MRKRKKRARAAPSLSLQSRLLAVALVRQQMCSIGVSRTCKSGDVQRVVFVYSQHFKHDRPTLSYNNPTYSRTTPWPWRTHSWPARLGRRASRRSAHPPVSACRPLPCSPVREAEKRPSNKKRKLMLVLLPVLSQTSVLPPPLSASMVFINRPLPSPFTTHTKIILRKMLYLL